MKRVNRSHNSDHPDVVDARTIVVDCHQAYTRNRSYQLKQDLKRGGPSVLELMIEEAVNDGKQCGEGWRIVNRVSVMQGNGTIICFAHLMVVPRLIALRESSRTWTERVGRPDMPGAKNTPKLASLPPTTEAFAENIIFLLELSFYFE